MDDYETVARATLQYELDSVISHMREAHATRDADAYKRYLRGISMDDAAAQDFIASDGTIESMTPRMWVYFESPLRPSTANVA